MYNFVLHLYVYSEIYHLVRNKCYITWCSLSNFIL